jgi:hypothetical protein
MEKIIPKFNLKSIVKIYNDKTECIDAIKELLTENENTIGRENKIYVTYNCIYLCYLNINFLKIHDKFMRVFRDKIFDFLENDDIVEFVEFVPYIVKIEELNSYEKDLYDKYTIKFNTKYMIGYQFKEEYNTCIELYIDLRQYLSNTRGYLPNDRIADIFNLFVKYEKMLEKNEDIKKLLKDAYLKSSNNTKLKYCYLSI